MLFTNSPFKPCTMQGLNNKATPPLVYFILFFFRFLSIYLTGEFCGSLKIPWNAPKSTIFCWNTADVVLRPQIYTFKTNKVTELCISSSHNLKTIELLIWKKGFFLLCSLLQNSNVIGYLEQNTWQVYRQSSQSSLRNRTSQSNGSTAMYFRIISA